MMPQRRNKIKIRNIFDMQENITQKFLMFGFGSNQERIMFEQRFKFDYNYKSQSEQHIVACNTKS